MLNILSWLLGSKTGQIIAAVVSAMLVAALVIWRAFSKGSAAEKAKQAQASLESWRTRFITDDEISKMSDDARRAELAQWVQRNNDGK